MSALEISALVQPPQGRCDALSLIDPASATDWPQDATVAWRQAPVGRIHSINTPNNPLPTVFSTFPAGPEAASLARNFIKQTLGTWCTNLQSDTVESARLLVSEMVTNSVVHSGASRICVLVARGNDSLHIEVLDDGFMETTAPESPAALMDERGRGLLIVSALSTQWGGPGDSDGGKRVWADLSLLP
ncbi:ATP-binding protein [Streptomyces sp. NPDC057686]|uniref:ATP-binding protein n=1 Tax=Streptomyces sp. NPDC057686 TaxID=3346212 RepID=UPI0036B3E108